MMWETTLIPLDDGESEHLDAPPAPPTTGLRSTFG
jgi:hypothetical protein